MSTSIPRVFGQGRHRRREVPILICGYHKVGTVLLLKVVRSICLEFGWSFRFVLGKVEPPPSDADVVVFVHSLVDLDAVRVPYTGVHFIRDPRDVIVSGYLYHRRCDEPWCTNRDLTPKNPIRFPKVPYSQEHRSEQWKKQYLRSLRGKSYQENLCGLDESDGLLFEMRNYAGWTIESMLGWDYSRPNILELHFETLMSDYDATFKRLFESFGFTGEELATAMRLVATEDLSRMTDEEVEAMDHVSSRGPTRWQDYFTDVHKEAFKQRFGDALIRLGYESYDAW